MSSILLLIGTRRGLIIARSTDRHRWDLSRPFLEGREVYHAFHDARTGLLWAATTHRVWGSHLHRSGDGGRTWETLEAAPSHDDERGLRAIWRLAPGATGAPDVLYAGVEPAGLFVSRDAGRSWSPVAALNDHPTRSTWQPMGGGLALTDVWASPGDGDALIAAISAGGVYGSDDAGASWTPRNAGVRACFQPERYPASGQCVHKLAPHPTRPGRIYQQNHCGTYRSDDAGDSWVDITAGLPSDYGYALAIDPADADRAWVVPEISSHMRTVVDGRLRVYETRDAGASWSSLENGLPQEHAYVTVLREGLATDGLDPIGVYCGTSGGHLFGSPDGGATWSLLAGFLPRILCVDASAAPE
ncbi:MAG: sialidase family protein [Gemmatimonadota bacterium]